jgi:methylase of polypeptide subunit release factors
MVFIDRFFYLPFLILVAMVVIEINRHVIGIDIDPQSLELAQENSADLEVCHCLVLTFPL